MTEDRNFLKKRPNWIEFVVDEISLVDVPAVAGAEIVVLKRGTMEKGSEEMNVAMKQFQDRQFPEHDVTDAEIIRIVTAIIGPLLRQVQELHRRIDRVVTGIRPTEDSFGAAVRGAPLTAAEEREKAARAAADPFGWAVREKRPALVVGHKFLKRRR